MENPSNLIEPVAADAPEHLRAPLAFAQRRALDERELRTAPVRYPRPAALRRPLKLDGARAHKAAENLGLECVGDLLGHLPRDRRGARLVGELMEDETATILVEVQKIVKRPVRKRGMRPLVQATVSDDSGALQVTFFNQPWLVERYQPPTRLLIHGKYQGRGRFSVQAHAPTDQTPGGGGEVAHYPATDGLSSTQILALVAAHAQAFDEVVESLPASLRAQERLGERASALRAAHFSTDYEESVGALKRLAFEELLLGQLLLAGRRRGRSSGEPAPQIVEGSGLVERWLAEELPFELTADQRQAIQTIDADLAAPVGMARLLMGEVGSGKTVVALYAMLRAVENDLQAALMAPTETLAEQHFQTIQKLLGAQSVRAALLTGSTPGARRAEILGKLASGELSLVVGTHALIEPDVHFAALAVAVVDEQHRFGVAQRAALDHKGLAGGAPHVLHMTATPIPRTLALTRFGDLDMTQLRGLPRGRQPVSTFVCGSEAARARAYERIREEVSAGRQAFVVCPLVQESESLEAKAAVSEFERLRDGPLEGLRLVLMHGQMRPVEKQQAMALFAGGEADVLVATTVIEVGIDVPNATVMLIEDADRYGLSQLHQLRGRIGRGEHASLCLLFGRSDSVRLAALARESDGFRLAEIDLELRGQGELAGTRQSGQELHRFAEFPRDVELLERARLRAREIVAGDPGLESAEHSLLGWAIGDLYGEQALNEILP